MQRVIIYLGCIAVPILLVPWAKTETAWSLVSFELCIFLALCAAGVAFISTTLDKKEKKMLYMLGIYYSLSTFLFFYDIASFSITENEMKFVILVLVEVCIALLCNLWGLYGLKRSK